MRTEEIWKTKQLPIILQQFSPRLQKDLKMNYPISSLTKIESMYIYGEVGSGKTVRAALMLLEILKQSFLNKQVQKFIFIPVPELLQNIKYSYDDNTDKEVLERYSDVDILVLDDFGIDKPSDWVLGILYLIINRRYENMKLTIFTSNFSVEEIAERLGDDRITSRIERMCKIIKKERNF